MRRRSKEQLVLWWRDWRAERAHLSRSRRTLLLLICLLRDVAAAHAEGRVRTTTLHRVVEPSPVRVRVGRWAAQQPAELRFAFRGARRRSGATLISMATLGLGVAAVTVVLAVVETVVLRPLPYPDSDRLVRVGNASDEPGEADLLYAVSGPDFRDLEERLTSLDGVAASRLGRFAVSVATETPRPSAKSPQGQAEPDQVSRVEGSAGNAIPESLLGAYVSSGFFRVLGVSPREGRDFARAEDLDGSPVIVVSSDFAERKFGSRSALGRVLILDQVPVEVVGVMPQEFEPPEGIFQADAEFWIPFGRYPSEVRENRADTFLAVVGRLSEGVSLDSARTELATLGSILTKEYPEANERVFGASSLKMQTIGGFAGTLWTLLGAVALLMLVSCTNLASLQLAAGIDRRREIAVRRSLGADRSQIVSQALNETFLLGIGASLLGGFAAWGALRVVRSGLAVDVPRLGEMTPSASLVWIALGLGMSGALLFGLVPQTLAARAKPGGIADVLRGGTRGAVADRGQERARAVLVIAETALAVVLVTGAALLLSSYVRLHRVDLGFDPSNVEGAVVRAPYSSPAAQRAFYDDLLERTRSLPSAQVAGLGSITPLGGGRQMQGLFFDRPDLAQELASGEPLPVHYQVASLGFLEALSIPLIDGRGFATEDARPERRTVLINQVLADEIAALGYDPLGLRFGLGEHGLTTGSFEIVGVVGSSQQNRLRDPRLRRVYFHYDQVPRSLMRLFVKTEGTASVSRDLRQIVADLAPEQPVLATFRFDEVIEGSLGEPRFYAQLIGALAAVAAALALVGVYSTLRFLVLRRRREVGLRMAIGATQQAIVRLVVGRGLFLVSAGLVLGVVCALSLMRVLESFLFEVAPRDPATYLLVVVCALVAGLAASFWPARDAARTSPALVLAEGD